MHQIEIERIKDALAPDRALASVNINCVGHVDYGNMFADQLRSNDIIVID